MTPETADDHVIVEAAVETIDGAVAAERAGAERLELCADLANGGTTPSLQLLEGVIAATVLPVQVMVRPRTGNFVYTDAELALMTSTIELLSARNPSGIVTGAITPGGRLDLPSLKRLLAASPRIPVTFHRAFDRVENQIEALDQLIELGVKRVLTSGGAANAHDGAERIAELVQRADGRIIILAGGGVRAHNVRGIIARTGVREVHARLVDHAQMKALVAAARD